LHQGQIDVASRSEKVEEAYTTKFRVQLPLTTGAEVYAVENTDVMPAEQEEELPANHERHEVGSYKILVVEDNKELREFLSAHLQENYRVLQAEDGAEGLRLATDEMPDIIITDIAMPNMNGFELVKALKADADTSHIPVVMLTARGESSDMLSGYRYGALYYITKPFVLEMLDVQLYNIMTTIERLKSVNRKYVIQDIPLADIPDEDAVYLEKLKHIILEKLSDTDFSVQSLASMMAQSQSSLLKKVKTLTGSNVSDLIKELRLIRASQLLMQSSDISSVAYAVGFSDRKYFSKEFKKHFGLNPTDYQSQKNDKN